MKIQRWTTQDLSEKLECVAKKINETVAQIGKQDPTHVVEHLQSKASDLLQRLRISFLGKSNSQAIPLTRSQIRKKVYENLDEVFQDPKMIELITDSIFQAAQNDPHYKRILRH